MRAATASVGLVSPRSTWLSIGALTPLRSARSRRLSSIASRSARMRGPIGGGCSIVVVITLVRYHVQPACVVRSSPMRTRQAARCPARARACCSRAAATTAGTAAAAASRARDRSPARATRSCSPRDGRDVYEGRRGLGHQLRPADRQEGRHVQHEREHPAREAAATTSGLEDLRKIYRGQLDSVGARTSRAPGRRPSTATTPSPTSTTSRAPTGDTIHGRQVAVMHDGHAHTVTLTALDDEVRFGQPGVQRDAALLALEVARRSRRRRQRATAARRRVVASGRPTSLPRRERAFHRARRARPRERRDARRGVDERAAGRHRGRRSAMTSARRSRSIGTSAGSLVAAALVAGQRPRRPQQGAGNLALERRRALAARRTSRPRPTLAAAVAVDADPALGAAERRARGRAAGGRRRDAARAGRAGDRLDGQRARCARRCSAARPAPTSR